MSTLVRTLLEGIIDYAGLFPPARLSMAEAMAAYRGYAGGPQRWIVDRFLCPASRLEDLAGLVESMSGEFGPIGVIGTGGPDLDTFETNLESDARAMTAFQNRLEERAPIVAFEVRRPEGPIEPVLSDLRAFDAAEVFLELPWGDRQADDLAAIAEAEWLGAKARTGGLEAAAFPSAEALARFLKGAQDLEVRFKLTAGLHHAVRTFDAELGVWRHGFLNILAAMRIHEEFDLSVAEYASILEQCALDWHEDGVRVADWSAGGPGSVREFFVGFGSCSVDEPLEELANGRLLEEVRS